MRIYVVCFILSMLVAVLVYALAKTTAASRKKLADCLETNEQLRAALDRERTLAREKEKIHAETEKDIEKLHAAGRMPLDQHVSSVVELLHDKAKSSRGS